MASKRKRVLKAAPESAAREAELNAINRALALAIREELPNGVGFALFVFDLGEGGFMTWNSNANRQDMVRALRELIQRLDR